MPGLHIRACDSCSFTNTYRLVAYTDCSHSGVILYMHGGLSNIGQYLQVGSVFRDIESELARLWNQEGQAVARTALGAVDIKETKDAYTFKLDAPGLTSKDVKVRCLACRLCEQFEKF